jgi:large subunit ribosomal protein L23
MNRQQLMNVLLAPHISEKGTILADKNRQFVFKVAPEATKPDIRQAVELMFDVKVTGVQISKVKGKQKRFGATQGRRPGWKKAYITLAEGHDIDYLGPQ